MIHAVAGEIELLLTQQKDSAPKEQPPRKLSGKEDRDTLHRLLERGTPQSSRARVSADGIIISGKPDRRGALGRLMTQPPEDCAHARIDRQPRLTPPSKSPRTRQPKPPPKPLPAATSAHPRPMSPRCSKTIGASSVEELIAQAVPASHPQLAGPAHLRSRDELRPKPSPTCARSPRKTRS